MADLVCGQGGSNGSEIIKRINDLTTLDPRATLALINMKSDQIFNDTAYTLIDAFNSVVTQRTGFVGDILTQSVKNNTGKSFESCIVTIGLSVSFGAAEELSVMMFINNVAVGKPTLIQGRGVGKSVVLSWQSDIKLEAGDMLDLRAKNEAHGDLVLSYEASHLRIDASWSESLRT